MSTRASIDGKIPLQHVEDGPPNDDATNSQTGTNWRLKEDAYLTAEDEHGTAFPQAVQRFPKAAFWSAVPSLCIVMEGYDIALISTLTRRQYGQEVGNSVKY
ncbi:hypothetical protein N7532_009870 [Penicillium argentinense]|uniref:Uncharacterized protein n=1 Tax=Penicillium argentinense TaxID=1131581 RepID=A0A9W9ENR5_9EURO|nr:uncharacterized protein N7532_009870 [Penicillium argentinense]KAJ5085099.1 hypothetical protein N7532_009870 [Penicillium argentinense]